MSGYKNIMQYNIGVGVVPEGKACKVINVGIQQAAAETAFGNSNDNQKQEEQPRRND
jgi:hypothetical protein